MNKRRVGVGGALSAPAGQLQRGASTPEPCKFLSPWKLDRSNTGTHVVDDLQANQLILGDALDLALEQIALEQGIALSR